MTLSEISVGIVFLAGAFLTGWLYTLSARGRTVGRDIQKANKQHLRWWLSTAFLGRHWPFIVLIIAYTLAFGVIASQLS